MTSLRDAAQAFAAQAKVDEWETSQPWNASKAAIAAGEVPGIRYDANASRGFTAHWDAESGEIVVNDSFFDGSELGRRVLLYHEAGHAIANEMTVDERRTLGTALVGRSPFAHSNDQHSQKSPVEIFADAYAALLTGSAHLSGGDPVVDRLFTAVEAAADRLGMPSGSRQAPTWDEWRPTGTGWDQRPAPGHAMTVTQATTRRFTWQVIAGERPDGTTRIRRGEATTRKKAQEASQTAYAELMSEEPEG